MPKVPRRPIGVHADYAAGRRRFRALVMASLVLSSFSILLSSWLFARGITADQQLAVTTTRIASEGAERRDQMCRLFEGEHLSEVNSLRLTYDYLSGLTAEQRQQPINRLLLRELPRTEMEAHADRAPRFCDEPGERRERLYEEGKPGGAPPVGLPEPDPEIPERPPGLIP